MFAGFLLRNIFLRRHNFGYIDGFLTQFRNEEMMGDGFALVLLRTVLNSKRLVSTSCNKQGQDAVAGSIFFMVLFPMLLKFNRIVCVEN